MVTTAVTAAGLQADDTTVTVSSDPPTDLIGLHADRVRVRATDATFRDLAIGELDLVLRRRLDPRPLRRARRGRLSDVTVADLGGREVTLDEIAVSGGGDDVTATTVIDGAAAERLIADAVEQRTGARPDSVTLARPDRLMIDAGIEVGGTLDVDAAGNLVLEVDDNPLGPRGGHPAARRRGPADPPDRRPRHLRRRPAARRRPRDRPPRLTAEPHGPANGTG